MVDDICVIRSMVADNINHNGACLQMNTGEQAFSRPSLGSWLTYGLGQREPRPARLRRHQPEPAGAGGSALVVNSFLPAAYQGTLISDIKRPIDNLDNADFRCSTSVQRNSSTRSSKLNRSIVKAARTTAGSTPGSSSFELAFRMQLRAPEAFDVARRIEGDEGSFTASTTPTTEIFGTQCLMARSLAERGVRIRSGLSHPDIQAQELSALGPARQPSRPSCGTTAPRPTGRSPAC